MLRRAGEAVTALKSKGAQIRRRTQTRVRKIKKAAGKPWSRAMGRDLVPALRVAATWHPQGCLRGLRGRPLRKWGRFRNVLRQAVDGAFVTHDVVCLDPANPVTEVCPDLDGLFLEPTIGPESRDQDGAVDLQHVEV